MDCARHVTYEEHGTEQPFYNSFTAQGKTTRKCAVFCVMSRCGDCCEENTANDEEDEKIKCLADGES